MPDIKCIMRLKTVREKYTGLHIHFPVQSLCTVLLGFHLAPSMANVENCLTLSCSLSRSLSVCTLSAFHQTAAAKVTFWGGEEADWTGVQRGRIENRMFPEPQTLKPIIHDTETLLSLCHSSFLHYLCTLFKGPSLSASRPAQFHIGLIY